MGLFSAIGSIAGGLIGGGAIGNALGGFLDGGGDDPNDTLQQSNNQANALALDFYNRDEKRNQPLVDARNLGLEALLYGLGLGQPQSLSTAINPRGNNSAVNASMNNQPTNTIDYNNYTYIPQDGQKDTLSRIDKLFPRSPFESRSNNSVDSQILNTQAQLEKISSLNSNGSYFKEIQALNDKLGALKSVKSQQYLQQQNVPSNAIAQDAQNPNSQNSAVPFGSLLKSFGIEDFQQDPGYKFRQDQGSNLLSRLYAGTGSFLSSGAGKGIQQFGQDLASQEYQNAYNRFDNNQKNQFNRLASLIGIGQQGSSALDTSGANYAQNVGNNITNTGSAIATGQLYNQQRNQINLGNGVNRFLSQYTGNLIPKATTYTNLNTGSFDPNFIGSGNASFGDL